MAAHKDIQIRFDVKDESAGEVRKFEAVGFMNEDEDDVYSIVDGYEMLRRTASENGGAIGEEDDIFLSEFIHQLPVEFHEYLLVTNRRHPDNPRIVSVFGWDWRDHGWNHSYGCLNEPWGKGALVVRRCP